MRVGLAAREKNVFVPSDNCGADGDQDD
jgi:hypothetical protein